MSFANFKQEDNRVASNMDARNEKRNPLPFHLWVEILRKNWNPHSILTKETEDFKYSEYLEIFNSQNGNATGTLS